MKIRIMGHFSKITTVVFCILQLLSLSSCAQITPQKMPEGEVLIVYLSRTKNTKTVAEIIQKKVGGELVSLELVNPYPENYKEIVAQVDRENKEGFLPELKTKINNLDSYNTIFVGFPTWDMQMPPPMKSFLTDNDLSGKTVIPFNTNAGYGVGSGFDTVEELCSNSKVLEGYSTKGGIERDGILFVMKGEKLIELQTEVEEWLQKIGFNI